MSHILYLFGQEKELLGKSQGIFKTDVCGNHLSPAVQI